VSLTTQFSQPLIGMLCCIFVGWIWHRNKLLAEIKNGHDEAESTLFWKVWPWYIKFVCPLAIAMVFIHSL
jgi:NSS family neurotransmitter:Na+ symporter